MSNEKKATGLEELKQLAQRTKTELDKTNAKVNTLSTKVEALETAGGEPNKLEKIKVNGVEQNVEDKAVDIIVPTKVSDLNNDSKYQTDAQVAAAIAAADHLKRKKVTSKDAIDLNAADADQYIYMVPKTGSKSGDKYDEYMILDGALERVGDWEMDLSGYVEQQEGKGLSSNDYTNDDKEKLGGMATGATKVEASAIPGNIKINGVETPVVEFATAAEVKAMLDEVFGAE